MKRSRRAGFQPVGRPSFGSPISNRQTVRPRLGLANDQRVGNPRYSRLETCATTRAGLVFSIFHPPSSILFAALLALQLLAPSTLAADKLQADLIPQVSRARNNAPIPVEARFNWDSTHILEGRLEMEFYEGNRVLGQYRSGDLALSGGEQKFRMLLPPLPAPFSDPQVEVRMKFITIAGNVIDIEPSGLFMPTASERSLVVGFCDASTAAGELSSDIVRNLRLERFAPDDAVQRLLTTSVVRLTPEDLPAQPLAYTSFDVVVLTAEAFKAAGERQLQALARWVRGGGSVCVFVGGGLQAHHLWFLNQLAESASGGPTFLADDTGKLLPAQKATLYLRSSVGRSVIISGDAPDQGSDADTWRKAATFLWKVRYGQVQTIANLGHWEPPANSLTGNNPIANYNYIVRTPQFPRNRNYLVPPPPEGIPSTDLGPELMNRLMPHTVRLIPFSALLGLLVLFVLLIGPADYFGLGLLRRRRFTWVLFPATSLAFTVATVQMANHYLGLRDQRRSLIVVDLARDGTALRWNQYQLVFAARDKQSVTELKDALWAPLNVQAMPDGVSTYNSYNPYTQTYYSGDAEREVDPPLYAGALPVHFHTSEALRQWRPELNRIFSFEPPPVPLLPNWPAIEEAWPNLQDIRAKLSANKPFAGDLCAIYGSGPTGLDSGSGAILPVETLEQLCRRNDPGLLSVVSQISPTGGGNFEDVQALDAEASDAVLAIVTQVGDDIVVYRRFFYGN